MKMGVKFNVVVLLRKWKRSLCRVWIVNVEAKEEYAAKKLF